MAPRIILIGPMGAGKTTVGKLLADQFQSPFRDTDEMIVAQTGREISDIFIEDGEEEFRKLEKIILRSALLEDNSILSLGGGACLSLDAQSAIKASGSFVVYLKISLATASSRVGFNQGRPLLMGNPRAHWQSLMNDRAPIYQDLSHFLCEVDGKSPEDIRSEIEVAYELRGARGSHG